MLVLLLGPGAREGRGVLCTQEVLGTPFRTYSNLFLIRIIFVADGVFLFESAEGSEQEIVHCKMLLTCELLQLIGR